MRAINLTLAVLLSCAVALPCQAKTKRSAAEVAAFKRSEPCPTTGKAATGPCKGQIVDHITPLCAGGADKPSNMQWQSADAAKAKDRQEKQRCAALRKK